MKKSGRVIIEDGRRMVGNLHLNSIFAAGRSAQVRQACALNDPILDLQ